MMTVCVDNSPGQRSDTGQDLDISISEYLLHKSAVFSSHAGVIDTKAEGSHPGSGFS